MEKNTTNYSHNNIVPEETLHQYIDEYLKEDRSHENELCKVCSSLLFAYCRKKSFDWEKYYLSEDDFMQNVMVNIFSKLHSYNFKYYFSSWVKKVCDCTLADMLETANKYQYEVHSYETNGNDEAEPQDIFDTIPGDDRSDYLLSLEVVKEGLWQLPEHYRKAVYLKKICGFSTRETARRLGVTEDTCNNWVSRGTGDLQKWRNVNAPELTLKR